MPSGITVTFDELAQLKAYSRKDQLFSPKRLAGQRIGDLQSSLRGRGMDFQEVRAYQPGDDIRHMDWRVMARTGKPHTKIFQHERERAHYLLVDFSATMAFATKVAFKSVVAAKIAALLSWFALQANDRVGGLFFTADQMIELTPRCRLPAVAEVLKQLALYSQYCINQQPGDYNLVNRLQRLAQWVTPGALIIVLSDFREFNPSFVNVWYQVAVRHELQAICIYDQIEKQLPPPNQYPITNREQQLMIDTGNKKLRDEYTTVFDQRLQDLKRLTQATGSQLIKITTADDVVNKIKNFYLC